MICRRNRAAPSADRFEPPSSRSRFCSFLTWSRDPHGIHCSQPLMSFRTAANGFFLLRNDTSRTNFHSDYSFANYPSRTQQLSTYSLGNGRQKCSLAWGSPPRQVSPQHLTVTAGGLPVALSRANDGCTMSMRVSTCAPRFPVSCLFAPPFSSLIEPRRVGCCGPASVVWDSR